MSSNAPNSRKGCNLRRPPNQTYRFSNPDQAILTRNLSHAIVNTHLEFLLAAIFEIGHASREIVVSVVQGH